MRRRWWHKLALATPVLGVLFALPLGYAALKPAVARAYDSCSGGPAIAYNRWEYYGYFDNGCAPFGHEVYDGGMDNPFGTGVYVNTPAEFINIVRSGASSGNSWYNNASRFIILSMLNYNGGVSRAQVFQSCASGATCVNEWQDRVTQMSNVSVSGSKYCGNNGCINFHYNMLLDCGTKNTFFQDDNGINDDVAPFIMTSSNSTCSGSNWNDTIAFFDKSNVLRYVLRRPCANPIGDYAGLPAANFNTNVTINRNGGAQNIVAGGTYSVKVMLTNTQAWSNGGLLTVHYPGNSVVTQPCSPTCTPAGMSNLLGGYNSYRRFQNLGDCHTAAGPSYRWDVDPLPPSGSPTTSGTIQFTVPTTTPVNTSFSFIAAFSPATLAGACDWASVSFTVVSQRYPGFAGLNGDAHAGGGLDGSTCGTYVGSGDITGNASGASYDDYLLSGSGTGITATHSNGQTGSDNAKLGNNGGYNPVCRPDLYKVAMDYRTGGGTGYQTRPAGTYDVGTFSGILYIDGNATLYGTVTNKLTVIVTGKTTFSGNVLLTGANYDAHAAPSLGIISSDDINIPLGVTQVDAYLFSNGTIDTCSSGQGVGNEDVCSSAALVVHGFLMGKDISFRRLGPLNGSAQNGQSKAISEQIILTPQIYLNPPKFFDASVDDILLEGQGERQPLF